MALKTQQKLALKSKTCQHCQHWNSKQSIFDFSENTGICLVPNSDLLGYMHQRSKEYFKSGANAGKTCFWQFSGKRDDKSMYFITRRNFGCIKFEESTLNS